MQLILKYRSVIVSCRCTTVATVFRIKHLREWIIRYADSYFGFGSQICKRL